MSDTETKSSPLKWILIGCGGCGVLGLGFIVLLGGGAFFLTKAPAEAAHQHYNMVKSGDVDGAYNALADSLKTELSREKFGEFVTSMSLFYKSDDLTLSNRNVTNNVATMSGHATTGTNQVPVTLVLVQDGEVWKVSGISVNE